MLTPEEIDDVNHYVYDKLCYKFGQRIVNEQWCREFTENVINQINLVQRQGQAEYFASRNKKIAEATEKGSSNG